MLPLWYVFRIPETFIACAIGMARWAFPPSARALGAPERCKRCPKPEARPDLRL